MTSTRARAARVKRDLKAGEVLAFNPVDVLGRKRLSHTIAFRRGRDMVALADGTKVGGAATLARVDHKEKTATAEMHAIDRKGSDQG